MVVLLWYIAFTVLLMALAKEQNFSQILLLSGSIISAIRVIAYFSEDLSRDIAKMFPFTIFTIFLLEPSIIPLAGILQNIDKSSVLSNNSFLYLLFIVSLEMVLRLGYIFIQYIKHSSVKKES